MWTPSHWYNTASGRFPEDGTLVIAILSDGMEAKVVFKHGRWVIFENGLVLYYNPMYWKPYEPEVV